MVKHAKKKINKPVNRGEIFNTVCVSVLIARSAQMKNNGNRKMVKCEYMLFSRKRKSIGPVTMD